MCAVLCCLIPSLVCDIEGERGQARRWEPGLRAPAPLKAGPKGVSLKGGCVGACHQATARVASIDHRFERLAQRALRLRRQLRLRHLDTARTT